MQPNTLFEADPSFDSLWTTLEFYQDQLPFLSNQKSSTISYSAQQHACMLDHLKAAQVNLDVVADLLDRVLASKDPSLKLEPVSSNAMSQDESFEDEDDEEFSDVLEWSLKDTFLYEEVKQMNEFADKNDVDSCKFIKEEHDALESLVKDSLGMTTKRFSYDSFFVLLESKNPISYSSKVLIKKGHVALTQPWMQRLPFLHMDISSDDSIQKCSLPIKSSQDTSLKCHELLSKLTFLKESLDHQGLLEILKTSIGPAYKPLPTRTSLYVTIHQDSLKSIILKFYLKDIGDDEEPNQSHPLLDKLRVLLNGQNILSTKAHMMTDEEENGDRQSNFAIAQTPPSYLNWPELVKQIFFS